MFLSAASSHGQIHKHGSVGAPRHLLSVVLVKPLTPCHWGASLSMATHRGGYQDSHQIKTHCLCFRLHQRQVQQQDQLFIAAGKKKQKKKRDLQSYWVHLCEDTHCSESEANARVNQYNLETG